MKLFKQIAQRILSKEIAEEKAAWESTAKLIALLACNNNEFEFALSSSDLEKSLLLQQNVSLTREVNRMSKILFSRKTQLPYSILDAVFRLLPDANVVANNKNDSMIMPSMFFADIMGKHSLSCFIVDNEQNGFIVANPKAAVITIPSYKINFKVELIKKDFTINILGCDTEICSYVWDLCSVVQVISEPAWEASLAFAKVQKELLS